MAQQGSDVNAWLRSPLWRGIDPHSGMPHAQPKKKNFQEKLYFNKFFFFFLVFLGPYPRHMEFPRLGVKSELQLLAYDTDIAMLDPYNPLSRASNPCPLG